MNDKEVEASIKMTALGLAGNSEDPEGNEWVRGRIDDRLFANDELIYGIANEMPLTEKRQVAIWTYRQALENGGNLTYIEREIVRAYARKFINYEEFLVMAGPWDGEYRGPGEPRVAQTQKHIKT